MMMAGPLHPPCRRKKFRSVPSPPDGEDSTRSIPSSSPHRAGRGGGPCFAKRENAPCTVEERKRGRARACLRFLRMSSARGVVRAGDLEVDARPVLLSSLPLIWRWTVGLDPCAGCTLQKAALSLDKSARSGIMNIEGRCYLAVSPTNELTQRVSRSGVGRAANTLLWLVSRPKEPGIPETGVPCTAAFSTQASPPFDTISGK